MLTLLVIAILSLSSVTFSLEVDPQRNFQLRECRQRSWRGDIGALPSEPLLQEHSKSIKVHSRSRRLIAWPSGSTLSVYPGLSVPLHTYINGETLSLYLGFPFTLNLPDGYLILKGLEPMTSYYYGNYTGTGGGPYTRQDPPVDQQYNIYNEDTDSLENFPHGYSSYSFYDPSGPYSKRSLDAQRSAGFNVLQKGLENIGLPGKSCLMRAVCEVADEPVTDLGLIGEVLNLFLAAGYGEGSDEMADFVSAEDLGRREGGCESQYPECPLHLADLLQNGLSYLHGGFAKAGLQGNSFL